VLKGVFAPKNDEVTGRWTKLHEKGFHNLFPVGATVHVESWPLIYSFLIIFTVGRAPWAEAEVVARPLPTQDNTNTE
jgi:hypothetical protein